MKRVDISERELDVIIDSIIHRTESLEDLMTFSVSPLAVKLRVKENNKILEMLRGVRDETTN